MTMSQTACRRHRRGAAASRVRRQRRIAVRSVCQSVCTGTCC